MPKQHPLGNHITFLRRCDGKRVYRSEQEAEHGRFLIYGVNALDYNSYRCEFCRQWHVGHNPGSKPAFAPR
jgi:hypothetical protein